MESETTTMLSESKVSESFMARSTMSSNIICCMCGLSFNPSQTKTTICLKCITNRTDVTDGITKEGILNFCRMCRRWLRPPWFACERESKQMMAMCLKKVNGLNKVKLIDAVFKWTEPHSRRIKLKVTIQKEIANNTTIQQTFDVEFTEHWTQCEDCKKEFTPHNWGASVQIRQKVEHKKTFLLIEQLILKHNAHDKVLKIEETEDGLDFYYQNKSHAGRIIDFLQNTVPITVIQSKQLISQDDSSNVYRYKYSWSVEIPPICRDDLVVIPQKLAKELGGSSTVLYCYQITNVIHLLDPATNKRIDMNAETYYHYQNIIRVTPFQNNATEFMVTDVETAEYGTVNKSLNNSVISSISNVFLERVVNVSVQRTSDWQEFHVKSHLGDILKVGTLVEGYDLTTLNCGEDVDMKSTKNYPDVILVRKVADKVKKSQIWKLKRLEVEGAMIGEGEARQGGQKKQTGAEDGGNDMAEFMDEIERNKDLRAKMNLFRDEEAILQLDPQELKKKSRVKQPQGRKVLKVKNTSNPNQDDDSQKPVEQKKQHEDDSWDDNEDDDDDDDIQIFELMAELNINDDEEPEVPVPTPDQNEQIVQDFIQQLDRIKIEK